MASDRPADPAVALHAMIAVLGIATGVSALFLMPGYGWTATVPFIIGAVAFLKLVHRLVKPPRTGHEEL